MTPRKTPPLSPHFPRAVRSIRSVLAGLAAVFGALLIPSPATAQDFVEDFESLSTELPGWSATRNIPDGPEYRPAAQWDTPFSFALDNDKPHAGSISLRLEFSADLSDILQFGPPPIPASGKIEIRFFVRTEGLAEDGVFSFDEMSSATTRVKSNWAVAKIPTSGDWTEVVWSGELDPETSFVRLRFVWKTSPAGAKIWIDDLTIKAPN